MKRIHMVRTIGLLALSVLAAALVAACSSSTETIVETVVVEKEVIKEVKVAGDVVEVVVVHGGCTALRSKVKSDSTAT